jgi:threonine dehydrogenase-like Zn-dependent dehydrogenase
MKAVVFHDIGDIRLDDVKEPTIQDPTDAVVRITASAICGTDLHMVRGTLPGMKGGTILGHEGVGVVEAVGKGVRNIRVGDRVVIPSTIACGSCAYCRSSYYSQCDNANPNGPRAGTAFYGGPAMTGPFDGLQAEFARIPFAHVGLVKLPDEVRDDQALMLSDIFPTGYFGADLAEIEPGDVVLVLGCGPVGLFVIASAKLMDAGRIIAVDAIPDRLDMARALGAEAVNFNEEDPVAAVLEMTHGIGADRAIDAVGIDAYQPGGGPAAKAVKAFAGQLKAEYTEVAAEADPDGDHWQPGDAPSLALRWGVQCLAKAGTLAVIGVYPQTFHSFPIGLAMNMNVTVQMGNCPHRRYVPELVEMVRNGTIDPREVLTKVEPLMSAIDAYKAFDLRKPGWVKVELEPAEVMA